jgi:hypothetical protein
MILRSARTELGAELTDALSSKSSLDDDDDDDICFEVDAGI